MTVPGGLGSCRSPSANQLPHHFRTSAILLTTPDAAEAGQTSASSARVRAALIKTTPRFHDSHPDRAHAAADQPAELVLSAQAMLPAGPRMHSPF
jgi:hypothetical protein